MTVDQGALSRAEEILSRKNSGPSGVLAYMWANHSVQTQTGKDDDSFVYKRPRLNKGLMADVRPFYAVVETDRSGLSVVAPPGGTQDVLFELYGQQQFAELAKPKKQIDLVAQLTGETLDEITDELFVAHLLGAEGVGEVNLESAFDAAVRETAEEHGWDFEKAKPRAKRVFDVDEELLSKRSFQTNPPTPIRQKVFVVEVDNFDGVIPRYTEKTETKIPSMLGNEFYEKGNFMDLREVQYSLNAAGIRLAQGDLPDVAKHDYLAAKSRFEMMHRIEQRIMASMPN